MPLTPEVPLSKPEGVRLQRLLSAAGIASRRDAENLIRSGRVSVDGNVVTTLGTRFHPDQASISVDGKIIRPQAYRYLALHKPSGFITSTSDERGRRTVMELIPLEIRVYPVGRLDRDTEGLLLFTNNGELANRIMHPRFQLTKEYVVTTPARPSQGALSKGRVGVMVDGRSVVPHEFRIVRETTEGVLLSVVVHEGMHHVVRRMMESLGIPVARLRRVRVGPISLAGIPRGAYRDLTPGEVASLFQAVNLDQLRKSKQEVVQRSRQTPGASQGDVSQRDKDRSRARNS